jgi:hypothetical protein
MSGAPRKMTPRGQMSRGTSAPGKWFRVLKFYIMKTFCCTINSHTATDDNEPHAEIELLITIHHQS